MHGRQELHSRCSTQPCVRWDPQHVSGSAPLTGSRPAHRHCTPPPARPPGPRPCRTAAKRCSTPLQGWLCRPGWPAPRQSWARPCCRSAAGRLQAQGAQAAGVERKEHVVPAAAVAAAAVAGRQARQGASSWDRHVNSALPSERPARESGAGLPFVRPLTLFVRPQGCNHHKAAQCEQGNQPQVQSARHAAPKRGMRRGPKRLVGAGPRGGRATLRMCVVCTQQSGGPCHVRDREEGRSGTAATPVLLGSMGCAPT